LLGAIDVKLEHQIREDRPDLWQHCGLGFHAFEHAKDVLERESLDRTDELLILGVTPPEDETSPRIWT
jgi:hypothetical protein